MSSTWVRPHLRNGRWVRGYHQRRPAAAAGSAVGVLVVVLIALWWMSGHGFTAPWAAGEAVTVEKVIDGDTIDVKDSAGATTRIRVLGINSPELAHNGRKAECYAAEAKTRTTELLKAVGTVALHADASQPTHDRYQRRLAYVTVGGSDLGLQLVRDGYAREYHPKNQTAPDRSVDYTVAQRSAKTAQAGLWGRCG